MTFTWEQGRHLAGMSGSGKPTITFKYNDAGIRTQKIVGTVTTNYHLAGGKVTYEDNGTDKIYYSYDSTDHLISMNLNGEEYFYIRNAQGDIIGLCDKSGAEVVSYVYDSLGKLVSINGTLKDSVGVKNPYRYRGYRYDNETGLYYLQSRYYNPIWGRFINADAIIGSAGELLGHNVFAYCKNNIVNGKDPSGFIPIYTEGEATEEMVEAGYKAMNTATKNRSKTSSKPKGTSHKSDELNICTDGATFGYGDIGRTKDGRPLHQSRTAYSIAGKYIDASLVHYVVVPAGYKGVSNGDLAIICDKSRNIILYAIVGERGNQDEWNEVSLCVAWDLEGNKKNNGITGVSGDFEIILYPGTKQNWKQDGLQNQINAYGRTIYP